MRNSIVAALSLTGLVGCAPGFSVAIDAAEAYQRCQYFVVLKGPNQKPFEFQPFDSVRMGITVQGKTVRIVAPYSYTYTRVETDTHTWPQRTVRQLAKAESLFDCTLDFIEPGSWNLRSLTFGSNAAT